MGFMDFTKVINYFTANNFHLKYWGLHLENFSELSTWYKIYWLTIHVLFMGIFNVILCINWILHTTSLESFADIGYIITTCLMGQIKFFLLLSNKKYLLRLKEQYEQNYFWPQNEEEWNIVHEELSFFKKAKIALIISSQLSIFSLMFTPLFGDKYDGLPVRAWYPINVTAFPAYQIALVHQEISIFGVGNCYILVEIMFSGALTFIGLQCNILSSRLKKIVKEEGSNQKIQRKLVYCIGHHLEIIKLLETTEKICGSIYFWQLFACTMTLCMDLFLLSLVDPKTFEFFYLIVYFTAIFFLLLVPCWFASEMTRKSENIPFAAYDCNWMDASDSFKKKLIIFMQRSQRPLKLYAANFFEISVEIFIKIVRASLSYFAVLNNLQNT